MKKRTTLKNKLSVKTSLRQRLLVGSAGMLLAVVVGSMIYLNFFASGETKANLVEDGETVQPLILTSICSENPNISRRWRVVNPNEFDVPIEWDLYPYFQTGLIIAHTGENFFYSNTIPGPNSVRIRWQDENSAWQQSVKASSGATCGNGGCYVSEVVSYDPKKRNDGSFVVAERRDPSKALGAPENDDALNFVSLGFGGEIVLKFSQPIANGTGDDIRVTESTFGNLGCNRYPEKIQAYASQDGCHFIYLGEQCQDATFDLGAFSWAQYIKLKDVSPVEHPFNNSIADGYDVDGVACLNGTASTTSDDGLVAGSAQEVVQYVQGTRKNGTAIHSSRTNPEAALGVPQNNDLGINFLSLGFTGSAVFKFDFVIFNRPGNDLQVVETSFGQQSCDSYRETAYFEGSLDGINWKPMGEVCLDGELDLGDELYAMQYLRATDRSPASEFPNSADGYDIDGFVVYSYGCVNETRVRPYDNNSIPDEIAEAQIQPNPFKDQFQLLYETGSKAEKVTVRMFNYVGQMVYMETINIPKNTKHTQNMSGEKLPKGVYVVTLESAGQKQSIKVIKN